ncbi:MAG: transcriptional repressor [Clostridia bacterium]|nr:transcriptional repressor [Clostridia bacterium]
MSVTRYSAQREAVLKELSSRYDHPTAEEIYFSVKKEISNISLATIYRNLTFLSDNGKAIRFNVNGTDRFDATVETHYHFVCNRCGKVSDIEEIETTQMLKNAEKKIGGKITSHSLTFFGICKNCAEEKI